MERHIREIPIKRCPEEEASTIRRPARSPASALRCLYFMAAQSFPGEGEFTAAKIAIFLAWLTARAAAALILGREGPKNEDSDEPIGSSPYFCALPHSIQSTMQSARLRMVA
jgi:hypothetical protein